MAFVVTKHDRPIALIIRGKVKLMNKTIPHLWTEHNLLKVSNWNYQNQYDQCIRQESYALEILGVGFIESLLRHWLEVFWLFLSLLQEKEMSRSRFCLLRFWHSTHQTPDQNMMFWTFDIVYGLVIFICLLGTNFTFSLLTSVLNSKEYSKQCFSNGRTHNA